VTAQTLAEHARNLNLAARKKFAVPEDQILPPLILMTDEDRLRDPASAIAKLPPGSAVIYRHYNAPDRLGLGKNLRALAKACDVLFLVAGDLGLASALGADGLHMPEELAMQLSDIGRETEFGFSTLAAHSTPALSRAYDHGASAALLSPVFATKSHPLAETLGAATANRMAKAAKLPVYALGGINDELAPSLKIGSFAGIAAIGALS
jgi:thiamine-phosphate pyrophosphorylase